MCWLLRHSYRWWQSLAMAKKKRKKRYFSLTLWWNSERLLVNCGCKPPELLLRFTALLCVYASLLICLLAKIKPLPVKKGEKKKQRKKKIGFYQVNTAKNQPGKVQKIKFTKKKNKLFFFFFCYVLLTTSFSFVFFFSFFFPSPETTNHIISE